MNRNSVYQVSARQILLLAFASALIAAAIMRLTYCEAASWSVGASG